MSSIFQWTQKFSSTVICGFVHIGDLRTLSNKDMSICFSTVYNRRFWEDLIYDISFNSLVKIKGWI